MRSPPHRRHARSAHGRLEEPAERIEQGDMVPPNGGRGASKIKVPETTVASPAGLEPATP